MKRRAEAGKENREYSDYLVQRVNELYHDCLGRKYDDSHPEIFQRLPARWQRLAPRFFQQERPLTILDLGTGTGFVPLMVGPLLKRTDTFICSDLSSSILAVAREHIESQHFSGRFRYVKINAACHYTLPFKDDSIDIITANSMLHHIKDIATFLGEIDRVLTPGGIALLAHEPHYRFGEQAFLHWQAAVLRAILCPRQTITRIARAVGMMPLLESLYYTLTPPQVNNKQIAQRINAILMQEGLITEPIAASDLKKITDIRLEGFNPQELFPNYSLVLLETYNHLSDEIAKKYHNAFIRAYERLLERKFPLQGNQFFMVKRKPPLQ